MKLTHLKTLLRQSSDPEGKCQLELRPKEDHKEIFGCPSIDCWPTIGHFLETSPSLKVVLVVGGSGFLGRHIICNLIHSFRDLREIRILDKIKPPTSFALDKYDKHAPVLNFYEGDITNYKSILGAFDQVEAVIHCASIISISSCHNYEDTYLTNVIGVKNVIQAMEAKNVNYLIYTSSAICSRKFGPMVMEDETSTSFKDNSTFDNHVFPLYSRTKIEAENSILSKLDRNKKLHAIILRPPGIYGEGDFIYLSTMIYTALKNFGALVRVGWGSKPRISRIYAGNCAWAHVCALKALINDARACKKDSSLSGKIFLIDDESSKDTNEEFVEPYLRVNNCYLSRICIPYFLIFFFLSIIELILRLISPIVKIKTSVETSQLYLHCSTMVYNCDQVRKFIGYRPRFNMEQSELRSMTFYRRLKENLDYYEKSRMMAKFK